MVTITLPLASQKSMQTYFVAWNEASTGCALWLGPFYLTSDGQTPQLSDESLNFGPPRRPKDESSVSGQNPVTHRNAKGSIKPNVLELYPQYDTITRMESNDSRYVGSVGVMTGSTGPDTYYCGYGFDSNVGHLHPDLYSGRLYCFNSVVYHWVVRSSYRSDAEYSSSGRSVTGFSKIGDVDHGTYVCHTRKVDLQGYPHQRNGEWYYTAQTWETAEHFTAGVLDSTTVKTTSRELPLLFSTPPVVFTQKMRSELINYVYSASWSSLNRLVEPEDIFGSLAKDALQSIRYVSSNNIENLSDLRDVKSIAPPLRSIKNLVARHDPRAIADIYLWYKYAFAPSYRDIPELIHAAARNKRRYTGKFYRSAVKVRTYTKMGLLQSCSSRTSVKFSVDPAFHAKMVMQSWGVDLSLANGWDLVPFSFVVDWFTHIGDTLDTLGYEFDVFSNTYHFEYVLCSNKVTASVPNLENFSGDVIVSLYHRTPLRSVPFTYDRQPNNASSHILEAIALLVTK